MIIDCTDKVITQWKKCRQYNYLEKYHEFLGIKTDVTIPIYKIDKKDFETIWPPSKFPREDCYEWRNIFRYIQELKMESDQRHNSPDFIEEHDFIEDDICHGEITATCSVVFMNEVNYYSQFRQTSIIDSHKSPIKKIIESPGIYIKNPVETDIELFEFILAYNMHMAETYYLYNRNVAKNIGKPPFSKIEAFLISLLTLRSINEADEDLAVRIREKSVNLIGSWRAPFVLLDINSIRNGRELSEVLNSTTMSEILSELLSGESSELFDIVNRTNQSMMDYKKKVSNRCT